MTTRRASRTRPGRVGLLAGPLAAATGEITASATRRGRSPSSGPSVLARGIEWTGCGPEHYCRPLTCGKRASHTLKRNSTTSPSAMT